VHSNFYLDLEVLARVKRLAEVRSSSPEAVLSDALDALEQKDGLRPGIDGRHPSGKPWPQRNPVGGIITPV